MRSASTHDAATRADQLRDFPAGEPVRSPPVIDSPPGAALSRAAVRSGRLHGARYAAVHPEQQSGNQRLVPGVWVLQWSTSYNLANLLHDGLNAQASVRPVSPS